MITVEIYVKTTCFYSQKALKLLKEKQINNLIIHFIDDNPELKEKMISLCEKSTVPQIWINNTHIGGCNNLYNLNDNGKLDLMLEK